jgi:hypothetical protein
MLTGDVQWTRQQSDGGFVDLPQGLGRIYFDAETSIQHTENVLWPSALLQAEWGLARLAEHEGAVVAELGCGVGLFGKVMMEQGKELKRKICTDRLISPLCRKNLAESEGMELMAVDWAAPEGLLESLEQEKESPILVTGSDLVYDNDVSLLLVESVLEPLFERWGARLECYLFFEKRVVLRFGEEVPCAPHYEFFVDLLQHGSHFRAERREKEAIPHVLPYQRTAEMEIWHLSAKISTPATLV